MPPGILSEYLFRLGLSHLAVEINCGIRGNILEFPQSTFSMISFFINNKTINKYDYPRLTWNYIQDRRSDVFLSYLCFTGSVLAGSSLCRVVPSVLLHMGMELEVGWVVDLETSLGVEEQWNFTSQTFSRQETEGALKPGWVQQLPAHRSLPTS